MKTVRQVIEKGRTVYYSNYAWRPGKLFDAVNRALTIFVSLSSEEEMQYTIPLLRSS